MSIQAVSLSAPYSLPRAFGRYQLFERIGAGGMAEIYLARARVSLGGDRLVVVKQIRPELSHNDKFAHMLIAEAKLAARLGHANIVQVFDLGRHQGVLFIAMEYVEGLDLNELLRRCAQCSVPLPVDFALFVVLEVLRGLSYAHKRTDDAQRPLGLIHRDVSPSNVLISFEGEVKLCDFGIARANDMTELLTDEVIQGKAGYMSPEQALGKALDARADLFSVGIVLWELLCGRKLYKAQGRSLLELARAAHVPPLATRGLPFENELHAIVYRALAANPQDRYGSAQSMLRDLEAYVAKARLIASPIRFGSWLRDNFGHEVLDSRRAQERAARAVDHPFSLDLTPPPPSADSEPLGPLSDEPEPDATPTLALLSTEPTPLSTARPSDGSAAAQASQPRSSKGLWIGLALGLALLGLFISFVLLPRLR